MANKYIEAAKRAIGMGKKTVPDSGELNYSKPAKAEAYFRIPGAGGYGSGVGMYYNRWSLQVYDGEKSLGNAGPIVERIPDQQALRIRGWEAYLTNETVQAVVNKCVKWIVGRGLKLQCLINVDVLESEGIKLTSEEAQKISDLIESRFGIYSDSKMSSYTGMKCLNLDEGTAYKNIANGGDVLVVLRYKKGQVKYELIDGQHVRSPQGGTDFNPQVLENGNRIMNGVEMNTQGEHVAYHVQTANLNWQRIPAKNNTTGLTTAYLVGGLEYRLDYSRTFPLFSGLFEIVKTLERYSDATLLSAEEQNKIAYQITSELNSTGETPFKKGIATAMSLSGNDGTIPVDQQFIAMQDKVFASTNKQAIHNVQGSKIEPLQKSESELYFKDFRGEFFEMICAAVNAPPNIIRSKYDTSYSSARASIKDWEHTLIVDRYKFSWQFRKPIYEYWLHMQVLTNKVNLPEYLTAVAKNNEMILAAYRNAEWIGDNVPHIDPVKEVMAERLKLGDTGGYIPLTTSERSTQVVNGGDFRHNIQQSSREKNNMEKLGIKPKQEIAPDPLKEKEAKAAFERLMSAAFNHVEND
jgi:capsid protein